MQGWLTGLKSRAYNFEGPKIFKISFEIFLKKFKKGILANFRALQVINPALIRWMEEIHQRTLLSIIYDFNDRFSSLPTLWVIG